MLTNQGKKQMLQQTILGLEKGIYENSITIKMQEAYGEKEEVTNAVRNNMSKQVKSLAAVNEELETVQALIDAENTEEV